VSKQVSIAGEFLSCWAEVSYPGLALIGPGDLLHLQVYDTPEMEQHARVTDTGNIPFSLLDR
jgi:hypothetical protein